MLLGREIYDIPWQSIRGRYRRPPFMGVRHGERVNMGLVFHARRQVEMGHAFRIVVIEERIGEKQDV
jgi:hypothetical protein